MNLSFELFVARRYLRAKRKEAAISVITVISVLGVAAGVMAMIVGLAINNGFRNTLQRNLLGATAHVLLLEKEPEFGIQDWRQLIPRLKALPHVKSVNPGLYGQVLLAGARRSGGCTIKGISIESGADVPDALRHLKAGRLSDLRQTTDFPGIILGKGLAESTGLTPRSVVTIISPQGELTPFGPRVSTYRYRVVGIFETGFFELDSQWAFTSLASAQQILSLDDVVNTVELMLDNIYEAPNVVRAAEQITGPKLAGTTWMEQNRSILSALRMEKIVTAITIGLIQLVGALNILIALIMLVMEKYKDIAILMSMGARREQIRRIFVLQGVLIGLAGTIIGLITGYGICYFADRYRWFTLDESVYALSYVPFEPRWLDGLWIAATALLISFIATLYPSRNATRIIPVEALRYE